MTDIKMLAGKTAVVTGGAAGIGEAVALLFGLQGANVAILDKDEVPARAVADAIVAAGGSALAIEANVRSTDAIRSAVDLTLARFGQIDILINNAGMYPRHRFVEMTEAQWDEIQDVNLKGVFRVTQAVTPHMISRRQGKIVNISSVTFHLGIAKLAHCIAAKGGVIGFTRALARELGPEQIHVNCITPGAVKTLSEATVATEEEANAVMKLQCLERRIMPVDIARVCLFLASEWSDGMTGQTMNVDGGWAMY